MCSWSGSLIALAARCHLLAIVTSLKGKRVAFRSLTEGMDTTTASGELALITQISPAAWRHILLNGHYTFQSGGKPIDLDAIVAGLDLR